MDNAEIEKSKAHILVEHVGYVPNAIVSKTILRRLTGNISISSLDAGERISPFDIFIQIIEGKSNILETGNGIIIPAHKSSSIKANNRFKMISTLIKSGYEEIII